MPKFLFYNFDEHLEQEILSRLKSKSSQIEFLHPTELSNSLSSSDDTTVLIPAKHAEQSFNHIKNIFGGTSAKLQIILIDEFNSPRPQSIPVNYKIFHWPQDSARLLQLLQNGKRVLPPPKKKKANSNIQVPFDILPQPSFFVDHTCAEIFANPAFCKMVAASPRKIQTTYSKLKNTDEPIKKKNDLLETILNRIIHWVESPEQSIEINRKRGTIVTCKLQKTILRDGSLFSVVDYSKMGTVEKRSRHRSAYEKLVSELTQFAFKINSFDEFIQQTLAKIGSTTGVSRVSIFENFNEGDKTRNRYEWTNQGIGSVQEILQDLSYSNFPNWKQILENDQVIVAYDIFTDLDPESHQILSQQQIKSLLVVPLWTKKKLYGFLGLAECVLNRYWSHEDISLLRSLAPIIELTILNEQIRQDNISILNALKQSEKQKNAILRSVPQGIALLRKRRIIWHNQGLEQLFGYSHDEFANQTIEQLFGEIDFSRADFSGSFISDADPNLFKSERTFKCKDGRIIYCLLSGARVDIEDPDEPPAVLVVFTDATALRQARLALEESEEKYSVLVERSNDGIVMLQNDGIFVFVNQRFSKITGFNQHELLGKHFTNFVPLEFRSLLQDRYHQRMMNQKVPDVYESKILTKSGQSLDVEISGIKIFYRGKETDMVYIRDISERKRLTDQIRFQATTLDHAGVMAFATDSDGRVLYVNQTVCETFNITNDNAKTKTIHDFLILPTTLNWQQIAQCLPSNQSLDIEVTAKSPSGKYFPALLTIVTLYDEKNEFLAITAIGKDIYDLKTKEVALKQSNRELRAFNEIARVTTQSLVFEELLQNILQTVLQILEMDSGILLLQEKQTGRMRIISSHGLSNLFLEQIRFHKFEQEKCYQNLTGGEIQYIEEIEKSNLSFKASLTEEGIQSILILPLISKNEILGTITLCHHDKYNISNDSYELLNQLKHQIGGAVENALLNTELQRRAKRMTALSRAVVVTNRLKDLDNLLPEFARILVTELGFTHSWIALKEPKSNTLCCVAVYGPDFPPEMQHFVSSLNEAEPTPPLQCLLTGKPIVFRHADEYPEPKAIEFFHSHNITSLFYVPIPRHNGMIGVVGVTQDINLPIEQDDILTVSYFAGQIHTALENTELYYQLQNNYHKVTRLQEMSQKMTSTLKLHEVFNFICKSMVEILGYEASWIGMKIPPNTQLAPVTQFNIEKQHCKKLKQKLLQGTAFLGPLAQVLRTKKSYIFRQERTRKNTSEWCDEMVRLQYLSFAGFPLLVDENYKGILVIYSKDSAGFPDSEISIIETFLAQAVTAIRNAQLFEESQKYANEIENKNKELEAFVYTVSHDLKAPIISLEGFTSLLLKLHQDKFTGQTLFYLQRIKENVDLMEHLISDLLDLSKIGRVVGKKERFNVQEVLEQIAASTHLQLQEKNLELIIPKRLPAIYGDHSRIQQVFENLIHNSIKFSKSNSKGVIKILYKNQPEFYQFGIQDHGIGIAPDYHKKIFDLFYRLDPEKSEGTGIGLTITKRIIEHHGGSIWVESNTDAGATFYFTLPKQEKEI